MINIDNKHFISQLDRVCKKKKINIEINLVLIFTFYTLRFNEYCKVFEVNKFFKEANQLYLS